VDAGRILIMRRKGLREAAWQMPQGGIGKDESPLEALYRELNEEAGLERRDVEVVASRSDWLVYELPPEFRNAKVGWGQAQRWFLCKLLTDRGRVHPDGVEFTDVDWVTTSELLARAVSFRAPIYRRVVAEFSLDSS
jgi:putative (di)nucleoside polyphosphate hydrolase